MSTTPGHDAADQQHPGLALSTAFARGQAEQRNAEAVTDKAFTDAESTERPADMVS
jgi:hypothetical protein